MRRLPVVFLAGAGAGQLARDLNMPRRRLLIARADGPSIGSSRYGFAVATAGSRHECTPAGTTAREQVVQGR